MKTLYLVRHAKSSWKLADILSDKERPLNKRGKRDAPFMGQILKEKGLPITQLVSSPAVRARTTAYHFLKALHLPENRLQIEENIYEASPHDILQVIQNLDDKDDQVALFGHNPTFTLLTNQYKRDKIDNLPTCGIVCINYYIDSWQDANMDNGETQWIEYPKLYFPKKQ